MKNKLLILSCIAFSFSALIQGHGLIMINNSSGTLSYKGTRVGTVKPKEYVLFKTTPTSLSIKRINKEAFTSVEAYLIKMALKKKLMKEINEEGEILTGFLTIDNDSIKDSVAYRDPSIQ